MTVLLVVLDGFGLNDDPARNALLAAPMWNWHRLLEEWPHARLAASGEAVGLPPGQMGNSEVGHLNLGAGFRVLQDLPRITAAIEDGSFDDNQVLTGAAREALGVGRPAPPDGARRARRRSCGRRAPRRHGRAGAPNGPAT